MRLSKKSFLVALASGALMFSASSALAKKDGPCKQDREALCKDVEHGEGRIAKCFKENEAKLSEGCKSHLAEKKEKMKEAMKEVHEACHQDVETHCGDETKGQGRIMKCLKKNKDQVSEACKAELKDLRGKRK